MCGHIDYSRQYRRQSDYTVRATTRQEALLYVCDDVLSDGSPHLYGTLDDNHGNHSNNTFRILKLFIYYQLCPTFILCIIKILAIQFLTNNEVVLLTSGRTEK